MALGLILIFVGILAAIVGIVMCAEGGAEGFLVILVGLFFIVVGTLACSDIAWRNKAKEAGHAEYYLDEKTHTAEWRWLPPCKENKP